jgi:hypothetical protein
MLPWGEVGTLADPPADCAHFQRSRGDSERLRGRGGLCHADLVNPNGLRLTARPARGSRIHGGDRPLSQFVCSAGRRWRRCMTRVIRHASFARGVAS